MPRRDGHGGLPDTDDAASTIDAIEKDILATLGGDIADTPPAPREARDSVSPSFRLSPTEFSSRRLSEMAEDEDAFAYLDPNDDLSMEEQFESRRLRPARRASPRVAGPPRLL